MMAAKKESHTITTALAAPRTEFSGPFVQGMANRMAVSFHKYGAVADAYPRRVDALASAEERIVLYERTGNAEFLMDAANFLMIEFMRPAHPDAHFVATDSDASPGRVFHDGTTHAGPNTCPHRFGLVRACEFCGELAP